MGYSATGVGSGNLTSTTSNLYIPPTTYTNNVIIGSSNPYPYGTIKTERLPMSEELYLYITGGKSCISTAPPIWNSQENCLWHAKGSRVLSIEGILGMKSLIQGLMANSNLIATTYLVINEFGAYTVCLNTLEEVITTGEIIKTKEDLIHRNRKK